LLHKKTATTQLRAPHAVQQGRRAVRGSRSLAVRPL